MLDYFKNHVVFCKQIVVEQKVNDRDTKNSELKKYLKKKIPIIISKLVSLFDPNGVDRTNVGYTMDFSDGTKRHDD